VCPDRVPRASPNIGRLHLCAFLNIAALDAPDGGTGCLFSGRDPSAVHGCKVAAFRYTHSEKPSAFKCSRYGYNEKVISNSPLTKRAWVCQELFLAPRCVLFGKSELIWSCRETTATELFPELLNTHRHRSLPMAYKYVNSEEATSFVNTGG
jgi:hypothetical protein